MRIWVLISSFLAISCVTSSPHGHYGQHNGPQRISYNQVGAYYNSAPQRARSARLFAAVKEPVAVPIRPHASTRYHAQDEFGQYHYGYRNGDGQSKTEIRGIDGGVAGKYSYVDPEGKYIELSYVADKNGFRASGEHLPKAPKLPKLPDILEKNNDEDSPPPRAEPIRLQPPVRATYAVPLPVRIVQAPQLQRNVREHHQTPDQDDDWKDEVEEKEKERKEKEKEREEEEEKKREEEEKKREEEEEERKKEEEEQKKEEGDQNNEDGEQKNEEGEQKNEGGEQKTEGGEQEAESEGGESEKGAEEAGGGQGNEAEGGENEGQEAEEGGAEAEAEGGEQGAAAPVATPVQAVPIPVPVQRPLTYHAVAVHRPIPVGPAPAPQPQIYARPVVQLPPPTVHLTPSAPQAPRPIIFQQRLQHQPQPQPIQHQPQPIRLVARPAPQLPVRVAVQPVKLVQVARQQQPIQVRLQQQPIQVNLQPQPAARLTLQAPHPVRLALQQPARITLHQQPSAKLTLHPQQHRPLVAGKVPFVVHQGHIKSGYQG